METETYPIDVPLAVVAVAASREGVILSIKLLWLVKQDKQSHEWKAENLPETLSPPEMKIFQKDSGWWRGPPSAGVGGRVGAEQLTAVVNVLPLSTHRYQFSEFLEIATPNVLKLG